MKKQLIAVVSALAMTFASLPCVSIAAENVTKPVLQYTFDAVSYTHLTSVRSFSIIIGASVTISVSFT